MLSDNILEVIINTLQEKPNSVVIDSTTKLIDIDIDSITFIQIIVQLENSFNVAFEDDKLLFSAFPTVGSMVAYVESLILKC